MAPARMTMLLTMATPRKMNTPSPPAPIAAAIVATPIQMIVATRTPAKSPRSREGVEHPREFACGSYPSRGQIQGRRGPRLQFRYTCYAGWGEARTTLGRRWRFSRQCRPGKEQESRIQIRRGLEWSGSHSQRREPNAASSAGEPRLFPKEFPPGSLPASPHRPGGDVRRCAKQSPHRR